MQSVELHCTYQQADVLCMNNIAVATGAGASSSVSITAPYRRNQDDDNSSGTYTNGERYEGVGVAMHQRANNHTEPATVSLVTRHTCLSRPAPADAAARAS